MFSENLDNPSVIPTSISCGVEQIANIWRLRGQVNRLRDLVNGLEKDVVYIFSDADRESNGIWLYNEIKERGLGRCRRSARGHLNPNSNHKISVYVWEYNGHRMRK